MKEERKGKTAQKKKMSAGARFANFGPLIGRLNPKRTGAPGPMPAKQPATSTSPLAHLPSIPASPPSLSALRPTQRHAPHIHNGTRIHPHQHCPATLPRFRSKKEVRTTADRGNEIHLARTRKPSGQERPQRGPHHRPPRLQDLPVQVRPQVRIPSWTTIPPPPTTMRI